MLSTVIFEHMSNLARIQSTLSTGQKKNIVPFFSTWANQRYQRSFLNICPIWPESSQRCQRVKKKHSPVFFDLGQSTLSTVIFEHMSNLARIQSTLSTGQKKNIVPFFRLGPVNAINGHFRTYVQSGQNPVNAVNGSKKKHSPDFFDLGQSTLSTVILEHMSNLARIQSMLSLGQKKNIVPFFSTWVS